MSNTHGGAPEFWRRVNSGEVRLSPAEDRRISKLRAEDVSFHDIATAILRGRRLRADRFAPTPERKQEVLRRAWAGRDQANATRWRDQIRRERANG